MYRNSKEVIQVGTVSGTSDYAHRLLHFESINISPSIHPGNLFIEQKIQCMCHRADLGLLSVGLTVLSDGGVGGACLGLINAQCHSIE